MPQGRRTGPGQDDGGRGACGQGRFRCCAWPAGSAAFGGGFAFTLAATSIIGISGNSVRYAQKLVTPKETLDCDLAAEQQARALYSEARACCNEVGDYISMKLFEALMADEEGHIDFPETQLDLCDRLGAERYAQLNATTMDEAE
ncbi:hypothetical protein DZD18_14090 [Rhodobacteraceae bacterium W635]|nr:hypothetical protein DZD18_14090 [Rhodobacteraceae bacterium W635]